jgi:hypothetical protein
MDTTELNLYTPIDFIRDLLAVPFLVIIAVLAFFIALFCFPALIIGSTETAKALKKIL